MALISVNPATGEEIRRYSEMPPEEVEEILRKADVVFGEWRRTSFADRAARMEAAAGILKDRRETLAALMADEMGKPLAQGAAEVDKCAWVCSYYARHAEGFLADEPAAIEEARAYVCYRPLGVILAVMPWNFPLWQVFRFLAPALTAGNAAVLKHASNVCGCALAIEEIVREAGFPEGLFRTLLLGSRRMEGVIAHPLVRAVTLTGSTPAGEAVAAQAGRHLKKTVLELGGSDPYVVLADADLERAAEACVTARMVNGGQSCIAAKRFIVEASVRDPFERLVTEKMAAKRYGDPRDPGVDMGPLARPDLRDELHQQVTASLRAGARLLTGGFVPEGPGAFYPPTVLSDVARGMPAFDEELFGPVAGVISAADAEEALDLANDTAFGLGAAVFTKDAGRGEAIAADRLDAGCCFVNTFVRSDPRLPFGGIKASGYGRELAAFGIREFVNVKTVYVAA